MSNTCFPHTQMYEQPHQISESNRLFVDASLLGDDVDMFVANPVNTKVQPRLGRANGKRREECHGDVNRSKFEACKVTTGMCKQCVVCMKRMLVDRLVG